MLVCATLLIRYVSRRCASFHKVTRGRNLIRLGVPAITFLLAGMLQCCSCSLLQPSPIGQGLAVSMLCGLLSKRLSLFVADLVCVCVCARCPLLVQAWDSLIAIDAPCDSVWCTGGVSFSWQGDMQLQVLFRPSTP